MKKVKSNRGLRHYWGLRVRGQHTKTTGRRGATIGVERKKKWLIINIKIPSLLTFIILKNIKKKLILLVHIRFFF